MCDRTDEKNENLTVVRGGMSPIRGRRRGRRPGVRGLSPEERELERQMRDVFVVLKGENGTTPSRGIAAICCDTAHPWRTLGLRAIEALRAGAPPMRVRAIGEVFLAWIDWLLARRRGGDDQRIAA